MGGVIEIWVFPASAWSVVKWVARFIMLLMSGVHFCWHDNGFAFISNVVFALMFHNGNGNNGWWRGDHAVQLYLNAKFGTASMATASVLVVIWWNKSKQASIMAFILLFKVAWRWWLFIISRWCHPSAAKWPAVKGQSGLMPGAWGWLMHWGEVQVFSWKSSHPFVAHNDYVKYSNTDSCVRHRFLVRCNGCI